MFPHNEMGLCCAFLGISLEPFLPRPVWHGQAVGACGEFGDQPYHLTQKICMCHHYRHENFNL